MLGDPDDLAILTGILGLASAFQRQAIAEGAKNSRNGTPRRTLIGIRL